MAGRWPTRSSGCWPADEAGGAAGDGPRQRHWIFPTNSQSDGPTAAVRQKSLSGNGSWLELLEQGEKPPAAETYKIAAWTFGNDLAMVFLADEVVVDYDLRMKREFDAGRLWINCLYERCLVLRANRSGY